MAIRMYSFLLRDMTQRRKGGLEIVGRPRTSYIHLINSRWTSISFLGEQELTKANSMTLAEHVQELLLSKPSGLNLLRTPSKAHNLTNGQGRI